MFLFAVGSSPWCPLTWGTANPRAVFRLKGLGELRHRGRRCGGTCDLSRQRRTGQHRGPVSYPHLGGKSCRRGPVCRLETARALISLLQALRPTCLSMLGCRKREGQDMFGFGLYIASHAILVKIPIPQLPKWRSY